MEHCIKCEEEILNGKPHFLRSGEQSSLSSLTSKSVNNSKNWKSKITAYFLITWIQFWRMSQIHSNS